MWLYRASRILGPVFRTYWRFEWTGAIDLVPATGPALLAPNHSSYLDPWFIGAVFPRPVVYLITDDWYHRSPLWRAVFRGYGCLPVEMDRPQATLDRALETLAAGRVLSVFPEGRLSRDGRIGRFRSGVARLAARSGAPVLPLGIRGAFESLPRHRRLPRPGTIRLEIGEPRIFPRSPWDEEPPLAALRSFRDELQRAVCLLAGQAPPAVAN